MDRGHGRNRYSARLRDLFACKRAAADDEELAGGGEWQQQKPQARASPGWEWGPRKGARGALGGPGGTGGDDLVDVCLCFRGSFSGLLACRLGWAIHAPSAGFTAPLSLQQPL